jgi:hypothetical protein
MRGFTLDSAIGAPSIFGQQKESTKTGACFPLRDVRMERPRKCFLTTYKTAGTAKVRGSRLRHVILWVRLWVGNFGPRDADTGSELSLIALSGQQQLRLATPICPSSQKSVSGAFENHARPNGIPLQRGVQNVMQGYAANGFVLQLPESRTKIYSWTRGEPKTKGNHTAESAARLAADDPRLQRRPSGPSRRGATQPGKFLRGTWARSRTTPHGSATRDFMDLRTCEAITQAYGIHPRAGRSESRVKHSKKAAPLRTPR